MIEYEIRMSEEEYPVPVAIFKDASYEMVGTFLLAEARSFGEEIMEALDAVCIGGRETDSFSGNVFSIEISSDVTMIEDDIRGGRCRIGTRDLRVIVGDYCKRCSSEKP